MNHNQIRFAQLTGDSQVEFTQAWDELVRYATDKAKGYFDDGVSRDEAIDEVMSRVTAWLIEINHNPKMADGINNSWSYLKKLIYNNLKKLSKERDSRPSYLESTNVDCDSEDDLPNEEISASGYRAFTPIEKKPKTKDSIVVLYVMGMSKDEIARELGRTVGHVRRVIQNSIKEIEAFKTLKRNAEN